MRVHALIAIVATSLAQFGCDAIGPGSLKQSRPDYAQVIQETTKTQNFLNLVRVHQGQPTLFMDVTEVDVGLQFQASLNGSLNFPPNRIAQTVSDGSIDAGHDYLVGGGAQYQETPTIRYVPVGGQALVAQLAAPISVDSIAALIDSQWPVSSVLAMAANRLTPYDADYYEALDAMIALDGFNALVIVPWRADPTSSSSDDTLLLYCTPERIRDPKTHAIRPELTDQANKLWDVLWDIYGPSQPTGVSKEDHRLELRSTPKAYPVSQKSVKITTESNDPAPASQPTTRRTREEDFSDAAIEQFKPYHQTLQPFQLRPVLRTLTAMGILRNATQSDLGWDTAVFVSADLFNQKLRPMVESFHQEISGQGIDRDYYVFDSRQFTGNAGQDPNPTDPGSPWHVAAPGEPTDDLTPVNGLRYQDFCDQNGYPERGDRKRHFLIVIYDNASKSAPANAFVSAVCTGKRFWIDGDDIVSQRNFALISHFLTIQAVAQGPQLTPTISVSGH